MCLAVPGKILSIQGQGGDPFLRTAKVDFGGIVKEANLAYVADANVGDYVIVHVGFAISRVEADEAGRILGYLKEIDDLAEIERNGEQKQ